MAKYACLNPIAQCGLGLFDDKYEKVEDMKDAQAVLVRSAAMHDLELPDTLEAVARAGAGVNNIPLDKCAEKGIVVFNTPGANANGVKELVLAGMLLGYFVIPEIFEDTDRFQEMSGDWLVAGICLLLGTVGFNLGLSGGIFEKFKGMGVSVIIIPVAAVAGSLICGTLYSFLSPMTMRECIAVSAGFGWYTMAPSVITEAGFAVAGAVSFMHNVIRETLGIVIIPLAAKKIGYLEAISIPGVAAMDVCLPIIEKSCRTETIVYSMCTGALMCVTVPIAVPLAIG